MAELKIPNNLAGLEMALQTSWAVPTAAGDWTAIQAFEIKFTPDNEILPVEVQKPESDRGPDASIVGACGGTLTFKTYMRGGGAGAGSGLESEFSRIARYAGGFSRVSEADDTDDVTAGAAGTITFIAAAPGVGEGILVDCNGTLQMRFVEVTAAAGNPITIAPNWRANPASADDLYATDTFTPDTGVLGSYLTFKAYQGHGATNKLEWLLQGCAGTWKIPAVEAGKLPIVEWSFKCDTWVDSEDSTTHTANPYVDPAPVLGSYFYVNDSAVAIASFGFDPGVEIVPVVSTAGDNGRVGWAVLSKAPTVDIVPYADSDWISRYEAGTEFSIMFESVKSTRNAWAIWLPKCQVVGMSLDDAGNGLLSTKPTIQINDPGQVSTVNQPWFALAVSGSGV